MLSLFFPALITTSFALLSYYPLFQQPNLLAGGAFLLVSVMLFLFFVKSASREMDTALEIPLKAIFLLTATLTLEAAGLWVYLEIFSRWRDLAFLIHPYKLLCEWLGSACAACGDTLYLYGTGDYIHSFSPNVSNLGLVFPLLFFSGSCSLFFVTRRPLASLKAIGIALGSCLLYSFIRTLFLIHFFLAQNVSEYTNWFYLMFFWHPVFTGLSFVPWLLLLYLFYRRKQMALFSFRRDVFNKKCFKACFNTSLGAGFCCLALLFLQFTVPSGREKGGKVLFDEYYSDWSESTRPLDENWYGPDSTYNYYTFRKYLELYFDVALGESPLEKTPLEGTDVLIIRIPTRPISREAVQKIQAYVKAGGGLWVIGDHTNVFGSATYLNPLLEKFGMKLRSDAVYHNEHGSFNALFQSLPVKHPVLHNVPKFLFATPCSIQLNNPSMKVVIHGEATKTYPASYANQNFFPDTKPDLNIHFGSNILLAAGGYGRGRVALFSDSTVFSNFFFYLPGKADLALSLVSWLNHENAGPGFKLGWIIVFLAGLLMIIRDRILKKKIPHGIWPFLFSFIFLIISLPVINAFNKSAGPLATEKQPAARVGFVDRYSSIYLPFETWKEDSEDNYNTFYLWGQRTGAVNKYYFQLQEALAECQSLFFLFPRRDFPQEDLDAIDRYLKAGGRLFLFDDGGPGSTADELLSLYGIQINYNDNHYGRILDLKSGQGFPYNLPAGTFKGDLLELMRYEAEKVGTGRPVLGVKKIGHGFLYVYGGARGFSNSNFGDDDIIPAGDLKAVNDLILRIYKMAGEGIE